MQWLTGFLRIGNYWLRIWIFLGATNSDLGAFIQGKANLLIGDIIPTDFDDVWNATHYRPTGTSSGAAIHDFLVWDDFQPMNQVKLLWDIKQTRPPQGLFWCLNCATADLLNDKWDFACNSDTVIIPISEKHEKEMRILSLFGGGYGGWTYAAHVLAKLGVPCQVVAVESNLKACLNYSINHVVPIINGYERVPEGLLDNLKKGCVIHGNAVSSLWVPAVAKWSPNIITISSPCPPWSLAGIGKGMNCADGLLLPESLFQARWMQPDYICIEQVAGFQHHHHKRFLMKTIAMIGYAVIWSSVVDLAHVGPVSRTRWLAILKKVSNQSLLDKPSFCISHIERHTPRTFDSILPTDETHDPQLMITPEMKKVADQPQYLPNNKRLKTGEAPFAARVYTADDRIPVIMASYGSQHLFPHDAMASKGCLAHFFADHDGARLLHPCEVAFLHGVTDQVFTFSKFADSWHILGNQIATAHALMVLTQAIGTYPHFASFCSMDQVFRCWQESRLTTSNTVRLSGTTGMLAKFVGSAFEISDAQHGSIAALLQLKDTMLPTQHWWDLDGLHSTDILINASGPVPLPDDDGASAISIPCTEQDSDTCDISATLPFAVTTKVLINGREWTQHVWVSTDVPTSELAMLWNGGFEAENKDDSLHLTISDKQMSIQVEHSLFVCMIEGRITIYPHGGEEDFFNCAIRTIQCDTCFDQFGPIEMGSKFFQDMLITLSPQRHGLIKLDPLMVLAAFQNAVYYFHYDQQHDVWTCHVQGDDFSRKWVGFAIANAIAPETLKEMGRTVTVLKNQECLIAFQPCEAFAAVPPNVMPMCLAVAFARMIMDSLAHAEGIAISLKWGNRILWTGKIDPSVTSEIVTALLMHALAPVTLMREVRLFHKAKRFASGEFNIFRDQTKGDVPLLFFLGFEMTGGAGSNMNKGHFRQQIRNSVAAWCLELGVELSWLNANLEAFIEEVGVRTLAPVIQQPACAKRDSQLHQLFANSSFKLPETKPKMNVSQQIVKARSKKRMTTAPDPQEFKLNCEFLLKEDGTPTCQLQDFRANTTGVYIANGQSALPWLRENQQLSTDELAMFVLGPLPITTTLQYAEAVLPAVNGGGQQVLLQGILVQLGAKVLKVKDWEQVSLKNNSSRVSSLTFWKSDWTTEEWNAIMTNTYQFVRDAFAVDGVHNAFVSFWGKSMRQGKQIASVKDATSVQIHTAITEEQFTQVLKLTGFNKIWAAPKAEDGKLVTDYRVLWLPSSHDLQKAGAVSAKINGVAGLVRGKSSLGIRVSSNQFETAWKLVYPTEQAPLDVPNRMTFKLEPLPYGCSPAMLQEWSEHVKWPFRPLRATGPKSWLVCAGQKPPEGPLAFNGHPVLPRFLPPKQIQTTQPILAGPRASYNKTSVPSSNNTTNASASDPWMQYRQMQGLNSVSPQTNQNHQGVTEQRFAQQDAKVAELENKIVAIQAAQTQQSGQIQHLQQDLVQTEQKISEAVQQSMIGVKNDLTKSFSDALLLQSKQFESNFLDLKNALMQTKRKTPSADANDMEP